MFFITHKFCISKVPVKYIFQNGEKICQIWYDSFRLAFELGQQRQIISIWNIFILILLSSVKKSVISLLSYLFHNMAFQLICSSTILLVHFRQTCCSVNNVIKRKVFFAHTTECFLSQQRDYFPLKSIIFQGVQSYVPKNVVSNALVIVNIML